jgi:hypothetical protein
MTDLTQPQDHKSKKPTVKAVEGGRRITFPGIVAKDRAGNAVQNDGKPVPLSVLVADSSLDDFELLDDLRAVDVDRNGSRLPALLRRLVGDDYAAVMDALRNEHGRVQIQPASEWIRQLMEALDPNS